MSEDQHDRHPEDHSGRGSSASTDTDLPDGVVSDEAKRRGLPPGAGTRGDDDDIAGAVREAAPYDDAPADGKFAPG